MTDSADRDGEGVRTVGHAVRWLRMFFDGERTGVVRESMRQLIKQLEEADPSTPLANIVALQPGQHVGEEWCEGCDVGIGDHSQHRTECRPVKNAVQPVSFGKHTHRGTTNIYSGDEDEGCRICHPVTTPDQPGSGGEGMKGTIGVAIFGGIATHLTGTAEDYTRAVCAALNLDPSTPLANVVALQPGQHVCECSHGPHALATPVQPGSEGEG